MSSIDESRKRKKNVSDESGEKPPPPPYNPPIENKVVANLIFKLQQQKADGFELQKSLTPFKEHVDSLIRNIGLEMTVTTSDGPVNGRTLQEKHLPLLKSVQQLLLENEIKTIDELRAIEKEVLAMFPRVPPSSAIVVKNSGMNYADWD